MAEPNDGGQAFPQTFLGDAGMTLRDWLAGCALQGMLASAGDGQVEMEVVVKDSWRYAELMLKERARG